MRVGIGGICSSFGVGSGFAAALDLAAESLGFASSSDGGCGGGRFNGGGASPTSSGSCCGSACCCG